MCRSSVWFVCLFLGQARGSRSSHKPLTLHIQREVNNLKPAVTATVPAALLAKPVWERSLGGSSLGTPPPSSTGPSLPAVCSILSLGSLSTLCFRPELSFRHFMYKYHMFAFFLLSNFKSPKQIKPVFIFLLLLKMTLSCCWWHKP